jgi:RNA polymerase sigma-70 factor, ECF subfamily
VPALPFRDAGTQTAEPATARAGADFERLYTEHFEFVWRTLRRLGVQPPGLDDAVQDVFIVLLKREAEFHGRSSHRTWLYGIASNVAHAYRRKQKRAGETAPLDDEPALSPSPLERASDAQAARVLERFLASLDDAKRDVFILVELEQLSAPEIAEALGVKLNTVYSRLRAARQAFTAMIQKNYPEQP